MVELPTKSDLQKLCQKMGRQKGQKGHDALVWYAWRNALRALPILGRLSVEHIWQDSTVRNVFAICRVSLVLAQWGNVPKQVCADAARATDAAIINVDVAATIARIAAATARAAYSANEAKAIAYSRSAVDACAALYSDAYEYAYADKAAVADYDLLYNNASDSLRRNSTIVAELYEGLR